MSRTALTAAELVIIRDLTADHGAKYYGGPMNFGRWDAVRYCTEGFVCKHPLLSGVAFNTLFEAVDAALSDEILAAGPLTDAQVKAAQAARWEAGGLVHDRAALVCFKSGDFAGALAELDAGEAASPVHAGPVTWDELRGHVNAKADAVAAQRVDALETAGRAAYAAGDMRAPALSPLVREAIAGELVGSPAVAAAMTAFTRGYDQAADEAAAAAS